MSEIATETTDGMVRPVLDRATEVLADLIGKAFDAHKWAGGDHTNHPLVDLVTVAAAAAAPRLAEVLAELDAARAAHVCSPTDYALVAAVLEHDYTVAPGTSRPYGDAVEDRAAALLNAGEMHRLLNSGHTEIEDLRFRAHQADLAVKYYGAQSKRRKAERNEARVVVEQVRSDLTHERELVRHLRVQLVPVSKLELDMARMERDLRAAVQSPRHFVGTSDRPSWDALLYEVSVAVAQRDHLRDAPAAAPGPCVEHDVFVERLRVAVGGSDSQGPEDWISAVEAGETAKDEEIRRLRKHIDETGRERSAHSLRGITGRDGTVRRIRDDEQPIAGDLLPYGKLLEDGSVEPYPEEVEQVAQVIANVGGTDRWSTAGESTRDDIRAEAAAAMMWLVKAGFISMPVPLRAYGVVQDDLPPGVVMTAQALWDAMRPQFDPNDGWTYDEIGPLLRTFTQVLIDNRGLLGQTTSDVVDVEATDG